MNKKVDTTQFLCQDQLPGDETQDITGPSQEEVWHITPFKKANCCFYTYTLK